MQQNATKSHTYKNSLPSYVFLSAYDLNTLKREHQDTPPSEVDLSPLANI